MQNQLKLLAAQILVTTAQQRIFYEVTLQSFTWKREYVRQIRSFRIKNSEKYK